MTRSAVLCVLLFVSYFVSAQTPAARLLRAASGPSGKAVGDRFVFNEERKRFVIPHDKSLVVYMEWEGPPGDHKITGIWKRPDGSTGFLSSDIEMISEGAQFNAYWTFYLNPNMESGIWQFEALVDGAAAGSYPFEVVNSIAAEPVVEAKVAPKQPTLDDLYALRKSLVWVHRLDQEGHRLGTMSGFVLSGRALATSFQAVDVADAMVVEFADGSRAPVNELLGYSPSEDWALLRVETSSVDALASIESPEVSIGSRLVAFNAEAQATRVIGGVDYSGRKTYGKLERFVFSPGLADEAMGGPLMDSKGNVVGVISGCVTPGTRLGNASQQYGGFIARLCTRNTAVPVAPLLKALEATPQTVASLKRSGVITPPVRKFEAFLYGGSRRLEDAKNQKRGSGRLVVDDKTEFIRADGQVAVYTWWQQPADVKKQPPIKIAAAVFDAENRIRVNVEPATFKPPKKSPGEFVFSFPIDALDTGVYRIDVLAEGNCVWRNFIEIRE